MPILISLSKIVLIWVDTGFLSSPDEILVAVLVDNLLSLRFMLWGICRVLQFLLVVRQDLFLECLRRFSFNFGCHSNWLGLALQPFLDLLLHGVFGVNHLATLSFQRAQFSWLSWLLRW